LASQSICEDCVISFVAMETLRGFASVEKLDIFNLCCGKAQMVGCHDRASMVDAKFRHLERSSRVLFPLPFSTAFKGLVATGVFVAQNELLVAFFGLHIKVQELFIDLASHDRVVFFEVLYQLDANVYQGGHDTLIVGESPVATALH